MFTGIIQNRGTIVRVEKPARGVRLWIEFERREKRALERGESIAVNGVCLTAAEVRSKRFAADIIPETLEASTLRSLKAGHKVNLERSLRHGDPLGGHFVTGHVDGRGKVIKITRRGANRLMRVRAPEEAAPYLAKKGSISVDGISLTIQTVSGSAFEISLVPHTLRSTTLSGKKEGDAVNLEVDLVARYVETISRMRGKKPGSLRVSGLRKQGF